MRNNISNKSKDPIKVAQVRKEFPRGIGTPPFRSRGCRSGIKLSRANTQRQMGMKTRSGVVGGKINTARTHPARPTTFNKTNFFHVAIWLSTLFRCQHPAPLSAAYDGRRVSLRSPSGVCQILQLHEPSSRASAVFVLVQRRCSVRTCNCRFTSPATGRRCNLPYSRPH